MEEFKIINHGNGPINLTHFNPKNIVEMRPTELHFKENGSLENKPSFALVFEMPWSFAAPIVYGQISLQMLNDGLRELGYEITKI